MVFVMQIVLLFFIFFLGVCSEICDWSRTSHVQEGFLGQTGDFSYIGVLIVNSRKNTSIQEAMAGIVLIKKKYALALAHDVARIPRAFFRKHTNAMFLPAQNTPVFVKPSSYVTHPDYPDSTLESFAIIKLNLKKDDIPLTPICLPTGWRQYILHTSKDLYLIAITDEYRLLEKVIYKIVYLDKTICEEYHSKNLVRGSTENLMPSGFSCGLAQNIEIQCFWENGMALVSNATGVFNLIGLTVYGPGCEAPARFMDVSPYLSWIDSVTKPVRDGSNDNDNFRRMKRRKKRIPNIPKQTLFPEQDTRRQTMYDYEPYPFKAESLEFHIVKPTKDKKSILIASLQGDGILERYDDACEVPGVKLYKEYFEVKAGRLGGLVTYQLSLYDLHLPTLACVNLTISCKRSSRTTLSFREELVNYKENIELREHSGETPEELFKYFPVQKGSVKKNIKGNFKEHDELYKPEFIKDGNLFHSENVIKNYDLFIEFEFNERAIMQFEMFADSENNPRPMTTTSTTTMTPTTTSTATTQTTTTTTTTPTTTTTTTTPITSATTTTPATTLTTTTPTTTITTTTPTTTTMPTTPTTSATTTTPATTLTTTTPTTTITTTTPTTTTTTTTPTTSATTTSPATTLTTTTPTTTATKMTPATTLTSTTLTTTTTTASTTTTTTTTPTTTTTTTPTTTKRTKPPKIPFRFCHIAMNRTICDDFLDYAEKLRISLYQNEPESDRIKIFTRKTDEFLRDYEETLRQYWYRYRKRPLDCAYWMHVKTICKQYQQEQIQYLIARKPEGSFELLMLWINQTAPNRLISPYPHRVYTVNNRGW